MKYIVFDLVGVLITEISFPLDEIQDKMERLFGKEKNDIMYHDVVRKTISSEIDIDKNIKYIIDHIYQIKYPNLFAELKQKYPEVKIVIATNHVSYIKEYIKNNFNIDLIDKIYVSADIQLVKPDISFFTYILEDLKSIPSELLFLDDNIENIETAKSLGIPSIKVDKDTFLLEEIISYHEKEKSKDRI
ncbi:MAG: HAD-IA family hydrolase [Bacilli bacterium]|nr:HAD-IA family hydrolase [Bacilli bacterium]